MKLGDLETLGKSIPVTDKVDGEHPKIKLDQLHDDDGPTIVGPRYRKYEDFEETGYQSNQFDNPLQKDDAPEQFFSMDDQENFNVLKMPLHPLDIEKDILDDFTVVVAGRRRSGKTWAVRWLMFHLRHRFPCGVVITGTKHNNFWARYIPEEFIHDVEDMNLVLRSIYARQAFLMQHPDLGIDPRIFVILDDVLKDKYKVRFSVPLATAFTDGRHYGVFTIITVQDPKGIGPDLRENTDLAIIFRQFGKTRKEAVSEAYLDYIEDKKQRDKFLWEKTKRIDHEGNVVNEADWTREELECDAIPVSLCVLTACLTENLQNIFKQLVAEDPDEIEPGWFLGDVNYWKAMESGQWLSLMNTFDPKAKAKKNRRGKTKKKK